jgi:hypothetical protein
MRGGDTFWLKVMMLVLAVGVGGTAGLAVKLLDAQREALVAIRAEVQKGQESWVRLNDRLLDLDNRVKFLESERAQPPPAEGS